MKFIITKTIACKLNDRSFILVAGDAIEIIGIVKGKYLAKFKDETVEIEVKDFIGGYRKYEVLQN